MMVLSLTSVIPLIYYIPINKYNNNNTYKMFNMFSDLFSVNAVSNTHLTRIGHTEWMY